LRALTQEQQRRPELKDTTDYIEAHFDNNPRTKVLVAHLRTVLAQQAHASRGDSGKAVAAHN